LILDAYRFGKIFLIGGASGSTSRHLFYFYLHVLHKIKKFFFEEGKKMIKIHVSSVVIRWGDKQVVLVSKPKEDNNKKKNKPVNGIRYQPNPRDNCV
jgi:hypothetical protein